jgi:hypothetical protein
MLIHNCRTSADDIWSQGTSFYVTPSQVFPRQWVKNVGRADSPWEVGWSHDLELCDTRTMLPTLNPMEVFFVSTPVLERTLLHGDHFILIALFMP